MNKLLSFLLCFFYVGESSAGTCFSNIEEPLRVFNQYFKDTKVNDIEVLRKYFTGENKHTNDVRFGKYVKCKIVYNIECVKKDQAVISYIAKKDGTEYHADTKVWMSQFQGSWYIDSKRWVKIDSKKLHELSEGDQDLCQ